LVNGLIKFLGCIDRINPLDAAYCYSQE